MDCRGAPRPIDRPAHASNSVGVPTAPDQNKPPRNAPRGLPPGPPPGHLPIVYQSARFVVIDKPSGLLSVPGRSADKSDCVRARVQAMFPEATGPMTVHRLDLETSGLIVLALDPEAQRALSIQFEKRRVQKHYRAILGADLPNDEGVVRLPIARDWPNRPRQKVCFETGRPAETRYRVLTRFGDRTRVEFTPVTGRSHQLRIHAAHRQGLNAPILGDALYGNPSTAPRLLLHATYLRLRDPDTDTPIEIESEAPF